MNHVVTTPPRNKSLVPAALIVAGGLVISALILKSDALTNPFFVPPGPGYDKVAEQFKTQMEAGVKGRIFAKTQRWDGVQVRSVTYEPRSKSYRVYYGITLHNVETNSDFNYESDCPLSPWGSDRYAGSCNRIYDPKTGHIDGETPIYIR